MYLFNHWQMYFASLWAQESNFNKGEQHTVLYVLADEMKKQNNYFFR